MNYRVTLNEREVGVRYTDAADAFRAGRSLVAAQNDARDIVMVEKWAGEYPCPQFTKAWRIKGIWD